MALCSKHLHIDVASCAECQRVKAHARIAGDDELFDSLIRVELPRARVQGFDRLFKQIGEALKVEGE